MKTRDRIKEEIGLYKLLITIYSAITSSIIGWVFTTDPLPMINLIACAIILFGLTIAITRLYFKLTTNIEDLDYV